MIAVICAVVLGFFSIYLWDKCPVAWVAFICIGFFVLVRIKKEVWIRGTSKPMNLKERLERNTKPPTSLVEAIREKTKLNAEAKIENPPSYRMREIAKRLIFIDGYMAGWRMENKEA